MPDAMPAEALQFPVAPVEAPKPKWECAGRLSRRPFTLARAAAGGGTGAAPTLFLLTTAPWSAAMRKTLIAASLVILSVTGAAAQRPTTTSLSCERIQGIVRREGGIVMYWQSQRVPGLPRYERLVRDSNFCPGEDYAEPFYVPSSDVEKCIVKHCQPRNNDDGIIFPRR